MRKGAKKDGGFTLIELLVVISIIGLLSSIVLASLGAARDKAKLTKAFVTMRDINNTAFSCLSDGSALIAPAASGAGGTQICAAEPAILPNVTDIGFTYCGTGCSGWGTASANSYAISMYSDTYSGGRKIVLCASNLDVSTWYSGVGGSAFNFSNGLGCAKYGF